MMPRDEMRAVAIDRIDSPEILSVRTVPLPEPEPDQILIRVASAGVGVWDIAECQGRIAQLFKLKSKGPWGSVQRAQARSWRSERGLPNSERAI